RCGARAGVGVDVGVEDAVAVLVGLAGPRKAHGVGDHRTVGAVEQIHTHAHRGGADRLAADCVGVVGGGVELHGDVGHARDAGEPCVGDELVGEAVPDAGADGDGAVPYPRRGTGEGNDAGCGVECADGLIRPHDVVTGHLRAACAHAHRAVGDQ